MSERQQGVSRSTYALADHLDAVLAATEDLLKLHADAHPGELLRIELIAISHTLQARQRLNDLRFAEARLADEAFRFLAGTDSLTMTEPVEEPQNHRALTKNYLIAGRFPLFLLADLSSGMLNALAHCYVLFPDGGREAHIVPDFVPPHEIWSSSNAREY